LSDELVFGVIAHDDNRSLTTSNAGGQSELWNTGWNQGTFDGVTGGAATKSGPGAVQLDWILNDGNDGAAMVAVAIKPFCPAQPFGGGITVIKNE
jgi:hypothetical protein